MSVREISEELLAHVGSFGIRCAEGTGRVGLFAWRALTTLFTRGVSAIRVIDQMNHIGVNSLGVVALTGTTVGAVLALHAYTGLHRYGADRFIGQLVYLSMTREFGSILSGIMVTARAGSAMTAELGTMRITEQIDALRTLSLNEFRYLIIPRIMASTLILPFLAMFCMVSGTAAGYVISIYVLRLNPEMYNDSIKQAVEMSDITGGLTKACVFGFLCALICCYKGFTTYGGAKGVGKSTIDSVVYSCVTIFVANYILSSLLFRGTT